MATDRIEKKILLHTPRERVWRAIASYRQFGSWFGMALDGPFVEGARLAGTIVPTTADEEVARLQKPYEGMALKLLVDRVEPMQRLSFRWHPFAVDPGVDYSDEPMTLVAFDLQEVPGGTLLTISESGFDRIAEERRAAAYAANAGGWEKQALLIEKYLAVHVG
jgi:uncharacterized protein YndB with AHSA1/START domain